MAQPLRPSEYEAIRKQNKVSESNFGNYFERVGSDIYRKGEAPSQTPTKIPTVTTNDTGSLQGTLSQPQDQLDMLSFAAKRISEYAKSKTNTPESQMQMYQSATGQAPFSPQAVSSLMGAAETTSKEIEDIYTLTANRIKGQQDAIKQGAEYIRTLTIQAPELLKLMTPEEFEYIKMTGFPPMSFALKMSNTSPSSSNIITNQETNDRGDVTIIARDKITGKELWRDTQKGIGKGKSAPVSIIMGQQQGGLIGDAGAKLNSTKGSDGYFNTSDYIKERNNYASKGQNVDEFDNTFSYGLNPNDRTAQRFLNKSITDAAADSWTPEKEQSFINMGASKEDIEMAKAAGLKPSDLIK